ncbi:MAG TPA: PPC domain-containing DNA-binding protein [Patescibacteria group bacterium]
MQHAKFGNKYFLRLDKGEEIVESLKSFCEKNKVMLGQITGIGAANKVTIGLFDPDTKKYHSEEFLGNYEIAPLSGNITAIQGEVYLHLHINISNEKHISFGGHLNSAVVSATFEAIIEKFDGTVEREMDPQIGLNLLKFNPKG